MSRRGSSGRMKVLVAVLLALLLCGQQGTRGEGRPCSAGDSIVQAHRTPRITQPGGKTWLGKKEGMQLEVEATGRWMRLWWVPTGP